MLKTKCGDDNWNRIPTTNMLDSSCKKNLYYFAILNICAPEKTQCVIAYIKTFSLIMNASDTKGSDYYAEVILNHCSVVIGYELMTWVPEAGIKGIAGSLRSRHNERNSVSKDQPHDCLLNHLFTRRSKKTSKLRVTGFCAGNSPETGEFPAQRASNAENSSIWRRHHVLRPAVYVKCNCPCSW